MVFNVTFNNISVIPRRSVFIGGEYRGPGYTEKTTNLAIKFIVHDAFLE